MGDVVGAKNWLESLDLVCESHLNYSGIVVEDEVGNSHFHCEDRWWQEQVSTGHFDTLESPESDVNTEVVLTTQSETIEHQTALNEEILQDGTDLNRLAYAVAMAETKDCGIDYGSAKYNNCFGIIRNGTFERYETKEESYKDFKEIWSKYYQDYPNWSLATKWTGGDRVDTWLQAINQYYHE